jgi:hypothetical protein
MKDNNETVGVICATCSKLAAKLLMFLLAVVFGGSLSVDEFGHTLIVLTV